MQWNATCAKYPNKACVVFDNTSYTFREMDVASNRIANWAAASGTYAHARPPPRILALMATTHRAAVPTPGLKRGDRVALVMENRPEFVMAMIGFAKAGVVLAMINNNLRSRSLLHCIKVSHSKIAVFGIEVQDALADVHERLRAMGTEPIVWGGTVPYAPSLDPQLSEASPEPVHPSMYNTVSMHDDFGFIYTSGTTGLPKAAVIKHAKVSRGVGTGA